MKIVGIFALVGAVAALVAFALDDLIRNPFLIGAFLQSILLIGAVAASVKTTSVLSRAAPTRWRITTTLAVLVCSFVGTHLFSGLWWAAPIEEWRVLSVGFGAALGAGIVLAAVVYIQRFASVPAFLLLLLSSLHGYALMFFPHSWIRGVVPAWLFMSTTILGWWFVSASRGMDRETLHQTSTEEDTDARRAQRGEQG